MAIPEKQLLWPAVGYLYILVNDVASGWVKIGKTHDVRRRLAQHNSGSNVLGVWTVLDYFVVMDLHEAERVALQAMGAPLDNARPEQFEADELQAWLTVKAAIQPYLMKEQPNLLPVGERRKAKDQRLKALYQETHSLVQDRIIRLNLLIEEHRVDESSRALQELEKFLMTGTLRGKADPAAKELLDLGVPIVKEFKQQQLRNLRVEVDQLKN